MKDILEFDAKKANELIDECSKNELISVLNSIAERCKAGKKELYLDHSLENTTIKELKAKGFKIFKQDSSAIQMVNLYYTISW